MLGSFFSSWAVCEGDMYLVSSEGHRVYTSHRLLAFSSPNFLAHILPSSTETALSLPFSSESLNVLLDLLSKGISYSEIAVDKAEVEEAALCLGIHLKLQQSTTELQNKCGEIKKRDPNNSSTSYIAPNHQEEVDITENVLDTKDQFNDSRDNFECGHCGKSYSEKYELRTHLKSLIYIPQC